MNDWHYDEYEKLYLGMIDRYPDPDDPGFFGYPEAGRALYVVLIFDMEIQNGGLAQFFWNCGASYARLLPDALKTTGLDDVADLYDSFLCENRITLDDVASFRKDDPKFEDSYERYDYDAFEEPYMKIWEDTNISMRFLDYAAGHPEIWETP